MENLFVGQKLWWVPSRRPGRPCEVEVLKIGRKWAQLSNSQRIDMQSLIADAGDFVSPGRCYPDRAKYELETSQALAWSNLRKDLSLVYERPASATLENIQAARKLLGISEGEA